MIWFPIAIIVLVFGLVLWLAIKMARAVQREVDKANKRAAESKKKRSPYHWVWGSFHWIWVVVIPAARYVYREWRTAPPNSLEKFLWTMLLAAVAAAVLWILLKIVDKLVNKDMKPVHPENAPERAAYWRWK